MPIITYIQASGESHQVDVANGESVMQGAVDNFIDGIVAECGGACCCATCHCYVADEWVDKAGSPDKIEEQMLASAQKPNASSRLAAR